ncbi:MAG: DUF4445 domain-containing protein [Gammaproteobacteria bacterium]|nr:DUF4445 domain-containing protein [Gammaproteobacteria bacterium]
MTPRIAPPRTGHRATFMPDAQVAVGLPGETVLDCARRAGVRIASVCGGRGLCRSCVIRVMEGSVDPPSAPDREFFSERELAENWRRACQTFLAGDCRIEVSMRALALPTRTHVASEDVWVRPDPAVRLCRADVPAPSRLSPLPDDRRLVSALNACWPGAVSRMDIEIQRTLSKALRPSGTVVAAVRFGEIIALNPPSGAPLPGLAVDLGTSNVGALLVDLRTGRTLERCGLENPQSVHGGDVISRIGYAISSPGAPGELRALALKAVNGAARSLCEAHGIYPEQIADIVIVGNTAMHHLLLGLPVSQLGRVPFVAAVCDAIDAKARDVGIKAMPGAYVHMLPNIAGFVGADHTAVLLAIASERESRTVIILDIGTNTEISLLHEGRLSSLSCPSGPAFEGGHVRCGMRSAPGAIESMEITADGATLRTIDDAPALGICGSGVLDIAAQLYLAGVVDASGRMLEGHPRVRIGKRHSEFVLSENREKPAGTVVFTQDDVRAVQLAKASIRSGITILLEDAGLREEQLDQVIIAGAFGNYLNLASAVAIGLLPPLPIDRFAQIGNAAAIGAKLALVSCPHRAEAQAIARRSRYVELAGSTRFKRAFMNAIRFPAREHTREIPAGAHP